MCKDWGAGAEWNYHVCFFDCTQIFSFSFNHMKVLGHQVLYQNPCIEGHKSWQWQLQLFSTISWKFQKEKRYNSKSFSNQLKTVYVFINTLLVIFTPRYFVLSVAIINGWYFPNFFFSLFISSIKEGYWFVWVNYIPW